SSSNSKPSAIPSLSTPRSPRPRPRETQPNVTSFSTDLQRGLRSITLLLGPTQLRRQADILSLHGAGTPDAFALALALEQARVALAAPLRDQRRVQALAAQEPRTLTGLARGLVLGQILQLLRRRER